MRMVADERAQAEAAENERVRRVRSKTVLIPDEPNSIRRCMDLTPDKRMGGVFGEKNTDVVRN